MSEDGVAGVGVGCIGEGRREILLGCGDVPRCCFCLNRCDGPNNYIKVFQRGEKEGERVIQKRDGRMVQYKKAIKREGESERVRAREWERERVRGDCATLMDSKELRRLTEMDRWRLFEDVTAKVGEVDRTNLSEMDR